MRVLVIVHGLPPAAIGGSEIHAWDLARELTTGFGDEVLVLTREANQTVPEHAIRHEVRDGIRITSINNTFADIRAFSDNYDDDRITSAAEPVIEEFAPDVAHVHHLTCLSTGLVRSLRRRRVPIVMTLHDYWVLCHRGQLLDVDGQPCQGPAPDGCRRCLGPAALLPPWAFAARRRTAGLVSSLPRVATGALRRLASATVGTGTADGGSHGHGVDEAARRFRHMRAMASEIDRFLVPSVFLLERFANAGIPRAHLELAQYGVDHQRFARQTSRRRREPGSPLRLGFLGSLMISKGAHVLLDAVAQVPSGSVTVDVLGAPAAYHGDASYERRLAPLLSTRGVRLHGPVAHEQVPAALAAMDILVVPSVWPENSPLVIREAFATGVPVVASHAGGISETVVDGAGGLLFRAGDAGALAVLLRRLIDRPELIDELRRSIPRMPSLADEARGLRAVLQSLVPSSPRGAATPGSTARSYSGDGRAVPTSQRRPALAAVVVHYRVLDETLLAINSLRSSDRPCDRVIVVDNDGDGRARAALAAAGPSIDYVPMSSNIGFPAGVNTGITRGFELGAERVLLLNSDALVRPDCIEEMERVMDECRAGVVGPVVLSRADPEVLSTAGIAYDKATGRMTQPGSGSAFGAGDYEAARSVDAVSGCVMLIDRAVIERVGCFDPDYFFGFEDIDFCMRARAAGFPVVLAGRAIAYHQGSQSVGEISPDRFYYAARNHLRLSRKIYPRSDTAPALMRSGLIVGLNLAHAMRSGEGSVVGRVTAVLQGSADGLRGRHGPRPA